MRNGPLISIIIPTYNEANNIVALVQKIQEEIKLFSYEILIIDDCSPDGTLRVAQNFFKGESRVRCYLHTRKSPELGDSILQGIQEAKGSILIGMDADFNHDPLVIKKLLKNIAGNDLVVASRFIDKGGMEDRWRYFTSYLFNVLLRVVFGFPITDNTSGFYAVRARALKKIDPKTIYSGYGEYHLRLVYRANKKGLRISEVPVFYRNRLFGSSKSKFVQMVRTYVCTAFELRQE